MTLLSKELGIALKPRGCGKNLLRSYRLTGMVWEENLAEAYEVHVYVEEDITQ